MRAPRLLIDVKDSTDTRHKLPEQQLEKQMSECSRAKALGSGCLRLLLAFVLLPPLAGWAQTYVGKVCLVSTITERQNGPVTPQVMAIQLDVTNLGGSTYAVAGSLPTADQPFVTTGYATVIGGELYFNMSTSQTHSDGWKDTGLNQTRLNLSTMSGTFYEIGHDFNPLTRQWDDSRYTAGTVSLSLAACQP